ncbi:MAG: sulfatase-like hydrolase/transferase [Verrucomicrobiota bacterium]|nr:sulfatase-like hydrolase/transferase [Verrucomicrobiota bacterium]
MRARSLLLPAGHYPIHAAGSRCRANSRLAAFAAAITFLSSGAVLFAGTDTDGDGLSDAVETNTGVFVSAEDTGTDPSNADTDGDGFRDGVEVWRYTDPCDSQSAPSQPNIIYILADDLGYGDLGCYGQQAIGTPHLDAMAAQGVKFTQHYSGSTVCAPSRSALMQGRHTGRCWVRGNVRVGAGNMPLPPETLTIGRVLQQAGYVTGCIGKWGLGYPGSVGHPNEQGFDHFFGWLDQAAAHEHYPAGDDKIYRNYDGIPLDGTQYANDLFNAEVEQFLQEHVNQPFLLYFCPTLPHSRMQAPPGGIDPEYARQAWPANEKTFATMVSELDRSVGRILQTLQALNLDENTLVVFSSDNGPHNEGGHSAAFFNSNGQLRGIKRDLYEGGIRVPMIARWPGHLPEGATSAHVSAFWDVMPTLAELGGAPMPADTDGLPFTPSLFDQPQYARHAHLYWEFYEANPAPRQGVRWGDWKGVRLNQNAPIQLYDLAGDPGETNDQAGEYPEVVAEIAAIMTASREASPFFPTVLDAVLAPHTAWFPLRKARA